MKYKITMKNGDVRMMQIIDPAATVDGEIAKWPDADDVSSAELIEE